MVISMLMAFAPDEGGEQNAPLGRAVATVATLFFVPTVFTVLHSRRDRGATLRRKPPNREQPPGADAP